MYLAFETHCIIHFLVCVRSLNHTVCCRNIHFLHGQNVFPHSLAVGYVCVTYFGQGMLTGSQCDVAKGLKVLAQFGLLSCAFLVTMQTSLD